jgi:hypothetical protein
MNAPTKNDATVHRTAAAINAARGLSVQANGMTDGQAPMIKKLKHGQSSQYWQRGVQHAHELFQSLRHLPVISSDATGLRSFPSSSPNSTCTQGHVLERAVCGEEAPELAIDSIKRHSCRDVHAVAPCA